MGGRHIDDDGDPLVREAFAAIYDHRYDDAYRILAPHHGRPADNVAAAALILAGRTRRAARWLRRMDPDEVNYGLVAALMWPRRRNREKAVELLAALPMEHLAWAGALALGAVVHRCGGDIRDVLGGHPDRGVVAAAGLALYHLGAFAESAAWWEEHGFTVDDAYNAACSWTRAGEVERALAALERAASRGYTDGIYADFDPDFARLRTDPRWPAVRARLGGPPPSG